MTWSWLAFATGSMAILLALMALRAFRPPLRRTVYDQLPTNIFAVIGLTYCHNSDDLNHTGTEAARIWYNVSMMRWEAGCPECGTREYGATPEQAASKWNQAQVSK